MSEYDNKYITGEQLESILQDVEVAKRMNDVDESAIFDSDEVTIQFYSYHDTDDKDEYGTPIVVMNDLISTVTAKVDGIVAVPDVKRSGYTNRGWYSALNGRGTSLGAKNHLLVRDIVKNCTLTDGVYKVYSYFIANQYGCVFHVQGGSSVSTQLTLNFSSKVGTTTPKRTGYTFVEWNTKSDGTGMTIVPSTTKFSDIVGGDDSIQAIHLYAIWTGKSFSYDKNAEDATGEISNFDAEGYGWATLASSGFTRSGYTLKCWNTRPDGTGYELELGTYSYVGHLVNYSTRVLYAMWEANE